MIELRWIFRPVPERTTYENERVLQYRTKEIIAANQDRVWYQQGWSEWRDVPTVKE